MSDNKLIIIFGAPGAGKGIQSSLLADRKKLVHLETSKALEKKFLNTKEDETITIKGKDYSLQEQEKRWREGLLCEDEFVAYVIQENLEELQSRTKNVLLDGYPRTMEQVLLALPLFLSFYRVSDILVISLEVSEEDSIKRNTKRRVCSLMRHSILNLPQTESLTVCPLDGSSLEQRVMDDPETIKTRLREFKEKTFPVLEYLASRNIAVPRIDGRGTVSEVFSRVLKEVEDLGL